ncbi:hypothetical protein TTRE_0000009501 [Trichuris trichiura]|uniref:Uncharacterized protein n=1 Tax=Trichuris trichiura TaxID=36087 RepID=A0A077YVN3_TRITR|nr:hypothetical protein TTRE_0000009501 [Trichuris trichiura]
MPVFRSDHSKCHRCNMPCNLPPPSPPQQQVYREETEKQPIVTKKTKRACLLPLALKSKTPPV